MNNSELAHTSPSPTIPLGLWQATIRRIATTSPGELKEQLDPQLFQGVDESASLAQSPEFGDSASSMFADTAIDHAQRNVLDRGVEVLSHRGRVRALVVGVALGYLLIGSALTEETAWAEHKPVGMEAIDKEYKSSILHGTTHSYSPIGYGMAIGTLGGSFYAKRRRISMAHSRAGVVARYIEP